jgi:hypothetical protein
VIREQAPTNGVRNGARKSSERDNQDAAAVLAVLLAIAGSSVTQREIPHAPSIWGDPAYRISRQPGPAAAAWWASGMPR